MPLEGSLWLSRSQRTTSSGEALAKYPTSTRSCWDDLYVYISAPRNLTVACDRAAVSAQSASSRCGEQRGLPWPGTQPVIEHAHSHGLNSGRAIADVHDVDHKICVWIDVATAPDLAIASGCQSQARPIAKVRIDLPDPHARRTSVE